jgi:hypothetical protein
VRSTSLSAPPFQRSARWAGRADQQCGAGRLPLSRVVSMAAQPKGRLYVATGRATLANMLALAPWNTL